MQTCDPAAFGSAPHCSRHDGAGAQGLCQDDGLPCLHSALAHQAALLGYAAHTEPCMHGPYRLPHMTVVQPYRRNVVVCGNGTS